MANTNVPGPTSPTSPKPDAAPGFSLRDLVVETLETTDLPLEAVADQVLSRVPKNKTGEALLQAMRTYVREVNVQVRRAHRRPPLAVMQETPGGAGSAKPRAGHVRSAKVAGIREWWRRQLEDRFEGEDGLKPLGDFTLADLKVAAETRRVLAEQNASRAAWFEHLAELVTEHDVETVRELPSSVLADVLGGEAA